MTAPPANKKGSRWGALLSGAVAGIESRLDTILAEDSEASARSRAVEKVTAERAAAEKNDTSHNEQPPTVAETEEISNLTVPRQSTVFLVLASWRRAHSHDRYLPQCFPQPVK